MITEKISMELQLWHQRYGHIGNGNLMMLIDKKMVDGLNLEGNEKYEKIDIIDM